MEPETKIIEECTSNNAAWQGLIQQVVEIMNAKRIAQRREAATDMRGQARQLAAIQKRFHENCPSSILNLMARDIYNNTGNTRVVSVLPSSLLNAFSVERGSMLMQALEDAVSPWRKRWPGCFSTLRLQVYQVTSACVLASAPRPREEGAAMHTVASAAWWGRACKQAEGPSPIEQKPERTVDIGLPWAVVMKTNARITGTTAIPGNGTGTWVFH